MRDLETSINYLRRILGDDMRPVQEQLRAPRKRGLVRKFVGRPTCSGKDVGCLEGKDGKCVACADDD